MSRPQNSVWILPEPQKYPARAPKLKNDPKIKSKVNARIKRNKENESCSTTWEVLSYVRGLKLPAPFYQSSKANHFREATVPSSLKISGYSFFRIETEISLWIHKQHFLLCFECNWECSHRWFDRTFVWNACSVDLAKSSRT